MLGGEHDVSLIPLLLHALDAEAVLAWRLPSRSRSHPGRVHCVPPPLLLLS